MKIMVSGATATMSEVASLYPLHLGHLLTPKNGNTESVWSTGLPVACDNGCFGGLDAEGFTRFLGRLQGKTVLWVTCPDKLADAKATLEMLEEWAPKIKAASLPVCLVLQDGQEDLQIPIADAYFIGGSTKWKTSQTVGDLAEEVKRRGAWLHMGRVNTLKRLRQAYDMGCDSVDGTCFSRWPDAYIEWGAKWLISLEAQPLLYSNLAFPPPPG